MHLFLIRHGETEHNVAGLLAGVSDSRLTNHGVLQTQRLGQYLTTHRNLRFTQIYASDLQRAFMTAEELQRNQVARLSAESVPGVVRLDLLREQDFGSLELVHWSSRGAQHTLGPRVPHWEDPSYRPQETTEAMVVRAELFLNDFILPHFAGAEDARESEQECVAVVSHGLFLSVLWRTLLRKFSTSRIALGPNVENWGLNRPLEHLPSWTNTGFLEVTIQRPVAETADQLQKGQLLTSTNMQSSALSGYSMIVHEINARDHLLDLKRTRGGLGSSPYDAKQQSLDGFFKRPNPNGPGP